MCGSTPTKPWQLQVFDVSIRKKAKWHWAKPHVIKAAKTRCLDVGSGVGTLSILMERLGGTWDFTETDASAAAETRKIVTGPVYVVDIFDNKLKAGTYDLITVFDVIEHVPDPQQFMNRLAELLKPVGTLILTTPAADGRFYFWRRLADTFLGIDKAAHGHVVEGFSKNDLTSLTFQAGLKVRRLDPFSFFFTEMIELAYNGAYIMQNRFKQVSTPGYNLALSPASGQDVSAHAKQLRFLRLVYPVLSVIADLDRVIPQRHGYEWGLTAQKLPASADTGGKDGHSPRSAPHE